MRWFNQTGFLVLAGIALALGSLAGAQEQAKKDTSKSTASRIETRTYDFKDAGKRMEYAVFVHSKYAKEKKTPLMVVLHGLLHNPQGILNYPGLTDLAEKHGYILTAPMGYTTTGWYGAKGLGNLDAKTSELSEMDVMNVLALARKEFTVDEQRIYLMGHSMGGGGTLHIAMKYPDLWAGLAAIAPAYFGSLDNLGKIKDIPVIMVQGDKDALVKPDGTRTIVNKMKDLKMKLEYVEIAGGDHIQVAYTEMPKVFEFFEKHRKKEGEKK